MVDYIRAEVYKVTHRKYLWGFLLIVGGLEALLVCMWAWMNGDMTNMSASTGFIMVLYLLTMGYYASAITTDMVFSDQYKFNTLKNEVAYGIPRARIYLGKLAVGCLVSLASCVVILLWYGILCRVLLPGDGAWLEALKCVGFALLAALPVWLGAQALFYMCFFLLKSSTAASLIAVGVVALMGQIIALLALAVSVPSPMAGELLLRLHDILLTTPLEGILDRIGDWSVVGWAWAVGIGWFLATTAAGVLTFRKREIS